MARKIFGLYKQALVHALSPQKPFQCGNCEKSFGRKDKLDAHIFSVHENRRFSCDLCGNSYSRADVLQTHRDKYHK